MDLERNHNFGSHPPRQRWVVVLVIGLVVLSSLACRIEIGTGRAVAAEGEAPLEPTSASYLASAAPLSIATPTSAVETSTGVSDGAKGVASTEVPAGAQPTSLPAAERRDPTPTPTQTPTPTATPTPVIPAALPPTRIVAQSIGLDAPISPAGWVAAQDGKAGSDWVVPDEAAGWHQNSALPGHNGNVVLSGHHNMGAEVFRHLVDLEPGDRIVLKADGRDYVYHITDVFILPERGVPDEQRRQNALWIMPTNTERLTLVTCWPYNDNSHRVIVLAEPGG
jgi:LPXTG-site transpeptidase (sortase) family protein